MKKKNAKLPQPDARSQMIAFSWSINDAGKILPWVNVNGEWVAQEALPANSPIEVCLTNEFLTINEPVGRSDCN